MKIQSKSLPDLEVQEDGPIGEALLERVTQAVQNGATDIEVQHRMGAQSWGILARLTVEPDDDPTTVARTVQACADEHAQCRGRARGYRAQIRAGGGSKRTAPRSYVAFPVSDAESLEDSGAQASYKDLEEHRGRLFDQQFRFCESLMAVALTRAESDANRSAAANSRETELVKALVGPAMRSVQAREQSLTQVVEARAEAEAARRMLQDARPAAKSDDGEFWSAMGPIVTQVGTHIAGRIAPMPPASTPRQQQVVTTTASADLLDLARAYVNGLGPALVLSIVRMVPEAELPIMDLYRASNEKEAASAILSLQSAVLGKPAMLGQLQAALGEKTKGLSALVAWAQKVQAQR